MAFDLSTAKPVSGGFDLSTARPAGEDEPQSDEPFSKEAYYRQMNESLVPVDVFDKSTKVPGSEDSVADNTLDVLGELAASANKSVTEFVDFIGPGTANAILRLAGSKTQLPTLTGAVQAAQEYATGDTRQGGFMEPGTARDVVRGAGTVIPAAGGLVPVARQAGKAGSVVSDLLGFGSTQAPAGIPTKVITQLEDVGPKVKAGSGKGLVDAQRKGSLLSKRGDSVAYGYQLDDAGNVVKDKTQKRAGKQGFDKGFVAMINDASRNTKKQMLRMIDVIDKGKKNFRYSAENRPIDVVGESIVNRVKVVKSANKLAGQRLDGVAENLKGQRLDPAPAVNDFLASLDDMGISFDPGTKTVSFDGSDIEGIPGVQRVVKNILKRMTNTKAPDAHDMHRLKKFIDEQVTYGKSARGLGGKVERILKSLRHNLDGLLDDNFPEYKQVNDQYSETIGAIDAIQDVAGKKMQLFGANGDKAVGTLSRRLLSNAQSRVPLKDALTEVDRVAQKYGRPGTDIIPYKAVLKKSGLTPELLDDDVMAQVLFVDELEGVLGPSARTSLFGDVEKAMRLSSGGAKNVLMETAVEASHKVRGITPDNALKRMRELLKEGM